MTFAMDLHQAHLERKARLFGGAELPSKPKTNPARIFFAPRAFGVPLDLYHKPGRLILVQFVALKHGVTVEDILGDSRSRAKVAARHHAMFLLYTHMPESVSVIRIGLHLNRDHTSVLHGVKSYATKHPEARHLHVDAAKARGVVSPNRINAPATAERRSFWTPQRIAALRAMRKNKMSAASIARELGASGPMVHGAIRRHVGTMFEMALQDAREKGVRP